MTDFLIKSVTGMAVFLGLYYLLLEREKMHFFNRFYLLVALAFSLALPFITFTIYNDEVIEVQEIFTEPMPVQADVAPITEAIDYTPYILLGFYLTVAVVLIFRFIKNLLHFKKAIAENTTVKHKRATLVLLAEKVLPHTFLHYIFINRQEYEDRLIEDDLFTHELTHVNQRHTLDILFMETLLTIFWFNPLLYFYKKAMKLNHEFLADESVVSHTHNVIDYQKLLLQKAVPATQYHLASSLNFSVTKKRFIMMTKATPKSKALLLKLAALPVVALLIYTLCTETVAQTVQATEVEVEALPQLAQHTAAAKADPKRDSYFAGVRIKVVKKALKTKTGFVGGEVIMDKLYNQLTAEDKEKYKLWLYVPKPFVKKSPTNKEIEEYKKDKKYAIWIDGKNVANSELGKYKPQDIAYFSGSVILKNARTKKHPQPFQYWFYTHKYFDNNEMGKEKKKYGGDIIEIFEDYDFKAESKTVTQATDTINKIKNWAITQNDTVKKTRAELIAEVEQRKAAITAERAAMQKNRAEMMAERDRLMVKRDSIKSSKYSSLDGKRAELDKKRAAMDSIKAERDQLKAIMAQRIKPKVPAVYQEGKTYSVKEVTTQPEYPGGLAAFYADIKKELKVPAGLTKAQHVYVSFIIEKDGSISTIKILRDASGLNLGEETERVLQKTKKWTSAKVENKPVRCIYNLPVSFAVKK